MPAQARPGLVCAGAGGPFWPSIVRSIDDSVVTKVGIARMGGEGGRKEIRSREEWIKNYERQIKNTFGVNWSVIKKYGGYSPATDTTFKTNTERPRLKQVANQ